MDDVEKITARARAAADGILAQAMPDLSPGDGKSPPAGLALLTIVA